MSFSRRHDLDALRALAMLLGIALHVALAYAEIPWVIEDESQHVFFHWFFAAIHGFRMPLFFVLSGFFTMMLWRKRGLLSLSKHRFLRIFLPCMLGLYTFVPAVNKSVEYIFTSKAEVQNRAEENKNHPAINKNGSAVAQENLWKAAASGDLKGIANSLEEGAQLKMYDPIMGQTPLTWAALMGERDAVELLLKRGAEINGRSRDGSTALHCTAFLGRVEIVSILLKQNAKPNLKNHEGITPQAALTVDFETTDYIAKLFKLELKEKELIGARTEVKQLLKTAIGADFKESEKLIKDSSKSFEQVYYQFLNKPIFKHHVFHHLWFLWFLCWLLVLFVIAVGVKKIVKSLKTPDWLLSYPLCLLWLIPLTMLPQWYMHNGGSAFGPDTSTGVMPMPHTLLYYAIFFAFGALLFGREQVSRKSNKWAWSTFFFTLLILFPLGFDAAHGAFGWRDKILATENFRLWSGFLQALYVWLMVFCSIDLFRRYCSNESKAMRYVSDSSYWMYLAHMPLVFLGQYWLTDWEVSAFVKFSILCLALFIILLVSYHFLVRFTPIGTFLNGRRRRPVRVDSEDAVDEPGLKI